MLAYQILQKAIREHGMRLMKRIRINDPFTNLPSEADKASFNPHSTRPCCSPQDFKWDPRIGPRSPWNKAVAEVFAADFIANHPACNCTREQVISMWIRHTEHLQATYKAQAQAEADRALAHRIHRRQERQRAVRDAQSSWPFR